MKKNATYRSRIVALLLSLSLAPCALASPELAVKDSHFVDPKGRVVILRGVNASGKSKKAPYLPFIMKPGQTEPDLTKLDPLPGWGINVLRLLFIWEGYEPEPGKYEEAYLKRLAAVVDAAWAKGIYTVIDFHQDAFSRFVGAGCGDGFPYWAVPAEYRVKPQTDEWCGEAWASKMVVKKGMHMAYKHFYADTYGARTAYLKMFAKLAAFFKSHPGVVGYDLFNEPWGYEIEELSPLYEDATEVIREQDPSAIIFISPHLSVLAGVLQTDLPRPTFDGIAYTPHFYDLVANIGKVWDPFFSKPIVQHAHNGTMKKAREWGAPLFVGEYGAFVETSNIKKFIDMQNSIMDADFSSGAQWAYTPEWDPIEKDGWNREDLSIVDDKGRLRDNFRPHPFAMKISGKPLEQKTERGETSKLVDYKLTWRHDPAKSATEIYVPSDLMSNPSLTVTHDLDLRCEREPARSVLLCSSGKAGAKSLQLRYRKP